MKWSENRGKLALALAGAAAVLKDPGKDRDVDAGKKGRWSYATLEGFLPEARAALAEQHCALVQGMSQDQNRDTWGVTTCITHESGEWVETFFPFAPRRLTDESTGTVTVQTLPSDPQALNSAFSYARRYAILGILSLVPSGEDDDGQAAAAAAAGKSPNRAREAPAAKQERQSGHDADWPADQRKFMATISDAGFTYDNICSFLEAKGKERPSSMSKRGRAMLLEFVTSERGAVVIRAALGLSSDGHSAPEVDAGELEEER